MSSLLHLLWADRVPPGHALRVIKVSTERGELLPEHDHDYPELFWLEEGACRHGRNGEEERLETGSLRLLRPGERHVLGAIGRRRFTMTNIECDPQITARLRRRHAGAFRSLEVGLRLAPGPLARLAQTALDLAAAPPDPLRLEGFWFDVLRLVDQPREPVTGSLPAESAPTWLREALLRAAEPEHFRLGAAGLARLAGRSTEHLSRSCREHLGMTPTAWLRGARMRWAERALRLGTHRVGDLARECGYATPAPFHRHFRATFGCSPRAYRKRLGG